MLTYLQGTTRPDISTAVHQCARFSQNPKLSHERAVKRIGRYLLETKERGICFVPDPKKGLEYFYSMPISLEDGVKKTLM